MRRFLLVLVFVALALIAVPANGQVVESRSMDVTGLKVNRAYFFGMVTTNNSPAPRAALVPAGGRSWPYLASLVALGLLWGMRRRDWPRP